MFNIFVDLEGGKFFFNTVREGDSVLFATEDEQEAHNWVMAFYRATGQAHKPAPPVNAGNAVTRTSGGKANMHASIIHSPYSLKDSTDRIIQYLSHYFVLFVIQLKLIDQGSMAWKNILTPIPSHLSIINCLNICKN